MCGGLTKGAWQVCAACTWHRAVCTALCCKYVLRVHDRPCAASMCCVYTTQALCCKYVLRVHNTGHVLQGCAACTRHRPCAASMCCVYTAQALCCKHVLRVHDTGPFALPCADTATPLVIWNVSKITGLFPSFRWDALWGIYSDVTLTLTLTLVIWTTTVPYLNHNVP